MTLAAPTYHTSDCSPACISHHTTLPNLDRTLPIWAAEPAGELNTIQRPIRPYTAKLLTPVSPVAGAPGVGDQWPQNGILYDYLLGYKFSVKDATEVSVRFPSLCCHLYES